jgi:hypothetical protein
MVSLEKEAMSGFCVVIKSLQRARLRLCVISRYVAFAMVTDGFIPVHCSLFALMSATPFSLKLKLSKQEMNVVLAY